MVDNQAGNIVYLNRFVAIMWFIIFPIVALLFFSLTRRINRRQNVKVVYHAFRPFIPYRYVMNNFLFVIICVANFLNLCFLISAILDMSLDSLRDIFQTIFGNADLANTTAVSSSVSLYRTIVCVGFFIHLIFFLIYVYHHLYNRMSYFSERYRSFLQRIRYSERLFNLRDRYPGLYRILQYWFLRPEIFAPGDAPGEVIVS